MSPRLLSCTFRERVACCLYTFLFPFITSISLQTFVHEERHWPDKLVPMLLPGGSWIDARHPHVPQGVMLKELVTGYECLTPYVGNIAAVSLSMYETALAFRQFLQGTRLVASSISSMCLSSTSLQRTRLPQDKRLAGSTVLRHPRPSSNHHPNHLPPQVLLSWHPSHPVPVLAANRALSCECRAQTASLAATSQETELPLCSSA